MKSKRAHVMLFMLSWAGLAPAATPAPIVPLPEVGAIAQKKVVPPPVPLTLPKGVAPRKPVLPVVGAPTASDAVRAPNVVRISAGTNETVQISLVMPNRIATPFVEPRIIHNGDESFSTQRIGQDIYVLGDQTRPIGAFIYDASRPNSQVASLTLVPANVIGQNIILSFDESSISVARGEAESGKPAADYEDNLRLLLRSLAMGALPTGYVDSNLTSGVVSLGKLIVSPEKQYASQQMNVYRYRIENGGERLWTCPSRHSSIAACVQLPSGRLADGAQRGDLRLYRFRCCRSGSKKLTFLSDVQARWALVPADRKRIIMISGILVVIFGGSTIFKRDHAPIIRNAGPKLDMQVLTAERPVVDANEVRAQNEMLKAQLNQTKTDVDKVREELAIIKDGARDQGNQQIEELRRDVTSMREDVRTYKSSVLLGNSPEKSLSIPPLPLPEVPKGDLADMAGQKAGSGKQGQSDDAPVMPAKPRNQLRISGDEAGSGAIVGAAVADTKTAPAQTSTPAGSPSTTSDVPGIRTGTNSTAGGTTVRSINGSAKRGSSVVEALSQFVPAGTIIRGILLNGMDAPTSGISSKQPVPALMRVKSLAFLPNRVTQDIRECFIILSGQGKLSSGRVGMRTETISCVREDGGVIEATIDGFAVGDDGKEGLKGTLVTKQGSLIARSLIAGFVSGFANIAKPNAIPSLNTSPGSTSSWQLPDMGMATQSGALTGMSSAANEIAKFYLETAKEMHPVVELPAETELSVVLVTGASLNLGPMGIASPGVRQTVSVN